MNPDVKKAIEERILIIERKIENQKLEFIRNNNLYNKNFNIKYATRAMEASNNIVKYEKLIESYKEKLKDV